MKQRIGFINLNAAALYYPQAESFIGGAEVDSYMIAQMCHELGHQVEVVITISDRAKGTWEHEGILLHNSTVGNSSGFTWIRKLWQLIRSLDRKIWFTKIISPVSALLGLYCMLFRRILIYKAANERDLLLALGKGEYSFKQRVYFHLTRMGTKVYIAQNDNQLQAAARWFDKPGRKLLKIPNTHRPVAVTIRPLEEREYILWVGHLKAFKGPEVVMQLAKAIPEQRFVMIAASKDTPEAGQYRTEIAPIPNIELIENVAFSDMSSYFSRALVLVNSSISEGFPNTFLQAFQTLTPLATTGIDPDGMIVRAGLGKVAADVEELANWLQDLRDQPEQYKEMQDKLARYDQEYFSYDKVKEQYRKLLEEIA